MEFKSHIIFGLIVSIIITLSFDEVTFLHGLVIFLASILIDVDHYFWYAVRFKDPNPLNGIKWYLKTNKLFLKMPRGERSNMEKGAFIFHDFIAWLALLILGFQIHPFFHYVLIGFAIHIIPDLIVLKLRGIQIFSKISFIYVLKTNKNKKRLPSL